MKILIFGLPGSGKTTLAKPFAELIGGIHINADVVRTSYDDWDFSPEGRIRQAQRMRHLADGVVMAGKIAVALVVLNRVNDARYPNTVCAVIKEGPVYESWKSR